MSLPSFTRAELELDAPMSAVKEQDRCTDAERVLPTSRPEVHSELPQAVVDRELSLGTMKHRSFAWLRRKCVTERIGGRVRRIRNAIFSKRSTLDRVEQDSDPMP